MRTINYMPPKRPKRYVCSVDGCGKAYNRPTLLHQHERTHTNDRPFACDWPDCGKAFFRKSHLQVHHLSHCLDEGKPFQCSICGKGVISPQLLRRHELTHTKKYKCTYDNCLEAFYRYQLLKHHVDTVHEQVLVCNVCNRRFQRPVLLAEHKLKHHGDVLLHLCTHPGCFYTCKDAGLLAAHKKAEHPEVLCPHCSKLFVGKQALQAHMVVHDEAKLWACDKCAVKVVKRSELVKHYHDIHEGKLPDSLVDLEVPNEDSLQTLMRDPTYSPNVVPEEERDRKRLRREQESEALPEKVPSIIDLVSGNLQKVYVCPRPKCQRKFTRHHAYEKHLKWHEAHLERIEEYLESLKRDEEELEHDELDHFTDISEASDIEDDKLETPVNTDDASDAEVSSKDEIAKKQKELDDLLSMELGDVN